MFQHDIREKSAFRVAVKHGTHELLKKLGLFFSETVP